MLRWVRASVLSGLIRKIDHAARLGRLEDPSGLSVVEELLG